MKGCTDEVQVLTERVKKRKQEYLDSKVQICPERSRLVVESWKQTEAEPVIIRWAKVLRKILCEIPISIREGELIVGSQTKYVRGCYPVVEWNADHFKHEFESREQLVSSGVGVKCYVTDEVAQSILEDSSYWKGKSFTCRYAKEAERIFKNRDVEGADTGLISRGWDQPTSGKVSDYEKVLKQGLKGVITEIKDELAKIDKIMNDSLHKMRVLEAMIISCEAVIEFAKRHANLAKTLANKEDNPTRRRELKKIADICEWVPENPARTFPEALQSFWFIYLAVNLETASFAEAPARFDQYMYPFYEHDIEKGTITQNQAAELLGLLWIKLTEMDSFKGVFTRQSTQATHLQNMTIGGVTADGRDATNDLSFLILEVSRQIKTKQPHLSLSYHNGMSDAFLIKAVETMRDIGAGIPAFFNNDVSVRELLSKGIPVEEARNWCPIGCVERYPIPSSGSLRKNASLSLMKIFELALHNGIDPVTGLRLGPPTGKAASFITYEQLTDAIKQQFKAAMKLVADSWNLVCVLRAEWFPMPLNSALENDCIRKGLHNLEGGLRWDEFTNSSITFGLQNFANSLAAIKKLVYEDKTVSWSDLLDALAVNFEGKEELRSLCLSAPKYGNDDSYVDNIMADAWKWTMYLVKSNKTFNGFDYGTGRQGLSLHYAFGRKVGALPDGRKAFEPLADGSLSPMRGTDTKGPTAILNSAAKIDLVGCESTLLNLMFTPTALKDRGGIQKFLHLVKSYFDRGGYHLQCNVIDKETLLDAKAHPERYRELLVRVAGFSAYFIELSPDVQDEIIGRTALML